MLPTMRPIMQMSRRSGWCLPMLLALLLATASACGNGDTDADVSAVDADEGRDAVDVVDNLDALDADIDDTVDTRDALAADTDDAATVRLCNRMAELCERRLDQVAFVTTHNAMANTADGYADGVSNQHQTVAEQLEMGVRAFMLDTHYVVDGDPASGSEVLLCHGSCLFGQRKLSDTLTDMRDFLETNPDEVIAIIFESYVSAEHTKASFDTAGVTDMLLDPSPDEPLPTLAEMIDSGRRMVVLTDRDGGGFPGYLPVWDWAWDNDWDNKAVADLNCDVNRGSGSNSLFIMNHFLTNPLASEDLASQINFNPFFNEQAFRCQTERDHRPNFVTVDFFDIGDVFDVVRDLNLSEPL